MLEAGQKKRHLPGIVPDATSGKCTRIIMMANPFALPNFTASNSTNQPLMKTYLAFLFLLAPILANAEDWPQLRGPSANGFAAPASRPPLEWSTNKNVVWKANPPGRGRSSPVILGDRIFITTALETNVQRVRIGADDMQRAGHVSIGAVCLDIQSGKQLWHATLFEIDNPDPVHYMNSWATPTPVVEPGRLYCDFGTFGTACLDTINGNILWKKQIALQHQVGPGSSPILYQNLLILVRDGTDAQFVTALNKTTGEAVWKTSRPPIRGVSPSQSKCFSTPLIITNGNQVQMFIPGPHWFAAYEPLTGREIWRMRHGNGFSLGSCPVYGHGLLYSSSGLFKPLMWAIRPDGTGELKEEHVAWKSSKQVPDISSPILVNDDIYWVSDDGTLTCSNAKTGEQKWQERLGKNYAASPLYAAGRLYFFDQDGKTTVIKPGAQLERLAENTLPGPLLATPAIVGNAIYLRTDSALYRLEERQP